MAKKLSSLVLFVLVCCFGKSEGDYWSDRTAFIQLDEQFMVGSDVVLSSLEEQANSILMQYKMAEVDAGFDKPETFPPARHFFKSKQDIEQSEVFKIIQKLPKGASLHSHDTAIVSGEYIYNLTYRDDLYGCVVNNRLQLHFFPEDFQDTTCDWTLVSELRSSNSSFDDFLKSQLTLWTENPDLAYPDINSAWSVFLSIFNTVEGMILYKPIFTEYFYQCLLELYQDNVMYMEFRGTLPPVYELNGTILNKLDVLSLYKATTDRFIENHPDFLGVRFIYAPVRGVSDLIVEDYLETVLLLRDQYPDFLAGFDLVGQEDKGRPLSDLISLLQTLPQDLKRFFHAGETDWYGTSTDFNLIDAVLLNTTRIGHGYALTKHPHVMEVVKEKGIGIEVCPISNQVLKLVSDLRNHPGSSLLAQGYPVVISNDDPSFWGAKALSYDWYMAFMGMASRNADLKLLKQLAMNSLYYSAIPDAEESAAIAKWSIKWDQFIEDLILEKNHIPQWTIKKKMKKRKHHFKKYSPRM